MNEHQYSITHATGSTLHTDKGDGATVKVKIAHNKRKRVSWLILEVEEQTNTGELFYWLSLVNEKGEQSERASGTLATT